MATPNPIIDGQQPAPTPDGEGGTAPNDGAALPAGGLPDPGVTGEPSATALPGPATSKIGLEGDLAADPRLKKFGDVEALAQSYLELESAAGNSIRIPGEAASPEMQQEFLNKLMKHAPDLMVKPDKNNPEQMEAFYQSLGRPAREDMYEVPEIKTPDGQPLDPAGSEALRPIAFKANLTEQQFKTVAEEIASTNIQLEQQQVAAWGEKIQELKKEWGAAYDDKYRRGSEIALRTKAPPEVLELLKTGYVSPETLRWLDNLAEILGSEGGQLTKQDGGGDGDGRITPGEAQAQLDEMMNNKEHPLWDSHHPDHQRAVMARLELQKLINPGASTDINDLRSGGGAFDS